MTTTLPTKYCKKYQSWKPRHSETWTLCTKVVLTISAINALISLSSELSTAVSVPTVPTPATDLDRATHNGLKQSSVVLQDLHEVAKASQTCMCSLRTLFTGIFSLILLQYHFSQHVKYLNLMKTTTRTIRWLQLITTNYHRHGRETLIRVMCSCMFLFKFYLLTLLKGYGLRSRNICPIGCTSILVKQSHP